MNTLRNLFLCSVVFFIMGNIYGYSRDYFKPPPIDPMKLLAEPRPVAPLAMAVSVADLRALSASGRVGEDLYGQYWLGVADTAEAVAAMERATGFRGQCCGRAAPLAYVGLRELTAGGFSSAVQQIAEPVTRVVGGRNHGASILAIWVGLHNIPDRQIAVAQLVAAGTHGETRRVSLGDELPPRRYAEWVTGCGL